MIKQFTLLLLTSLGFSHSFAQDTVTPDNSQVLNYTFAADEKVIRFNKGKLKVSADMFNKSTKNSVRLFACLDCHGKNAQGGDFFSEEGTFYNPSLVGLSRDYIKSELISFKRKERIADEMNIIASLLTDETIDYMAAAFSAYPSVPIIPYEDINNLIKKDALFRKGKRIAMQGDDNKVIACFACHGMNGIGAMGPRLAGQSAGYIRTQMANYRNEIRGSKSIMKEIAVNITNQDIAAVAHYYESLSDTNRYSFKDKFVYEKDE